MIWHPGISAIASLATQTSLLHLQVRCAMLPFLWHFHTSFLFTASSTASLCLALTYPVVLIWVLLSLIPMLGTYAFSLSFNSSLEFLYGNNLQCCVIISWSLLGISNQTENSQRTKTTSFLFTIIFPHVTQRQNIGSF